MIAVGNSAVKAFLGGTPVKVYLGDILLTGDAPEDEYTGVLPAVINTDGTALENYRIYGHSSGCGVNTKKVAVAELEQGTLKAADGTELSSNYRVRTKLGEIYPAGTYTISFTQRQQGVVVYVYDENEVYKKNESLTSWQRQPVTITITEPRYIRFVIAKLASGSSASTEYKIVPTDVTGIKLTTADPLGYNIPIISRTANRFGGALQQGTLVSTGYEESSSNKVRCSMGEVLPAGTYIIDADGVGGGIAYVYDSSYTKTNDTVTTWSALPLTITLSQAGYIRPVFAENADGTGGDITPADVSNVMISKSSEYPGRFVPYRHVETLVEVGSTPLYSGEYVSLSEQKIYRYSGGVLTPENPPASLPGIPAFTDCKTVLDYEEAPAPASVYFKFDPA
jgi:hypothetical protein